MIGLDQIRFCDSCSVTDRQRPVLNTRYQWSPDAVFLEVSYNGKERKLYLAYFTMRTRPFNRTSASELN